MLLIASIFIILIVGYFQYQNGLSSSVAMLISVLLSGLVAFNLWEPVADLLDTFLQNGALAGCEDLIALVLIFSVSLLLLRIAIFTYLAPDMIDQHGALQFFGAGAVGFITGYLVAGFFTCAMQTLPLDERFMDFEPTGDSKSTFRSVLPPDRVWLYLMRQAGAGSLSWKEDDPQGRSAPDRFATFDRHGTFELRYTRYRRLSMPYMGEFDKELYGRLKPR